MNTNSKAWLDGKRAGAENEPEHNNPYRGADFETWLQGWKAGCAERENWINSTKLS